jgi:hypothetical protein
MGALHTAQLAPHAKALLLVPQDAPPGHVNSAQLSLQLPAEQNSPVGQMTLQPPQLRGSFCVSTQASVQSVPLVHEQAPPAQVPRLPSALLGQRNPQPLQFSASLMVSTQTRAPLKASGQALSLPLQAQVL